MGTDLSKEEQEKNIAEARLEQEKINEMRARADRAEQEAERERARANEAKQAAERERDQAKAAEQEAARTKEQARKAEGEEQELARQAKQQAAEADERAKKASREAARANEQAEKATREAEAEKRSALEALQEAHTQRERYDGLESHVEDGKSAEQRKIDEFNWGPKKSHDWTDEEYLDLVKKIKETKEVKKQPTGRTFLLFGPASHGKSSFANGCLAALDNLSSPPMRHHVSQGVQSVSRTFATQDYGPHRIIDMPGIFESETITSDSIKMIVTGQIDWSSKITTTLEIVEHQTAYDNSVECIIIVMRYDCDLPPQLKRQIEAIMEVCGNDDVSCHLVLTHLDICDPEFKDTANLPYIYKSAKVLTAVKRMWEQTGIPASNISFVKNYTVEQETDLNSKLQYLRVLSVAKDSANFVVEARESKARDELKRMKKELIWGPKNQPEWSEQEFQKLSKEFKGEEEHVSKDGLKSQKPDKTGLTFLLFGPTGHGKSSFGNSCWAAVKDMKTAPTYHEVRQSDFSVSSQFSVQKHGPKKIIDMPGIFEAGDIKSKDIKKIVTGQVPWDTKITTTLETEGETRPSGDTVECIIIILRYDADLPPELRRQIKVILDLSGEGELSYHLVLTHLDICDRQFRDTRNLPNIYDSVKVLKAVQRMSKETGIPPSKISFVKNYTTETETDLNSKLQCLRILEHVKEQAETLLEKKRTKADITKENLNKTRIFPEGMFGFHGFLFFFGVLIAAVLIVYFNPMTQGPSQDLN